MGVCQSPSPSKIKKMRYATAEYFNCALYCLEIEVSDRRKWPEIYLVPSMRKNETKVEFNRSMLVGNSIPMRPKMVPTTIEMIAIIPNLGVGCRELESLRFYQN